MASYRNPYFGYEKDDRSVRSLWERFNAGLLDIESIRDTRQQLLVREWQRCSALGVDVAMNRGLRLNEAEYERRRNAGNLLLTKSQPILQGVIEYLHDVPGIMILTESTGTILHVEGDVAIREIAAERSGIIEGSVWLEEVAGSNGIGSALTLRQPVHVFSSEHFCEGWHSWTCAAAPILEPDGDTLLGVVDFTTINRDYRDQALGLAVSLAKSIQAQIALYRELEKRRLLAFFTECSRRYPRDDLIAIDLRGRPVANSQSARCVRLAELLTAGGRLSREMIRTQIDAAGPDGASVGSVIFVQNTDRPTARVEESSRQSAGSVAAVGEATATRFGDFLTVDPETVRILADLPRLAGLNVNVLVVGETGTGKELLARHIHDLSPRKDQPYLAVNCGAISGNLLESTFFGYVRGAFSGADPKGRAGYFEAAGGGTLFLDEIGELPLEMQAALLRVLEDGGFQRVGSYEPQKARCRIIAATNRNLLKEADEGAFRRDLYYRLNVVKLTVPPLRQRGDDIPLLAQQLLARAQARHKLPPAALAPQTLDALGRYSWPGNVRELRNAMEFAAMAGQETILPEHLPYEILEQIPHDRSSADASDDRPADTAGAARDRERERIIAALRLHRKANRAAAALGMARSTLYRKLEALGIDHTHYL